MYLEHFSLTSYPFSTAPDPRFYYPSARHREALACLLYVIEQRRGFALITGEVGAGKTMLCRATLERLDQDVDAALIVNTLLSPLEFLQAVALEFGVEPGQMGKIALLKALESNLTDRLHAGRNAVLIVDEAQNLSRDVLEELRLLGNLETSVHKLVQIILLGQPELRQVMGRPELRSLDQRMAVKFHLGPLGRSDTHAYIRHRLSLAGVEDGRLFSAEAADVVFEASGGVPRLINVICDQAMLQAYAAEEPQVSPQAVRRVVAEMQGYYSDEPEAPAEEDTPAPPTPAAEEAPPQEPATEKTDKTTAVAPLTAEAPRPREYDEEPEEAAAVAGCGPEEAPRQEPDAEEVPVEAPAEPPDAATAPDRREEKDEEAPSSAPPLEFADFEALQRAVAGGELAPIEPPSAEQEQEVARYTEHDRSIRLLLCGNGDGARFVLRTPLDETLNEEVLRRRLEAAPHYERMAPDTYAHNNGIDLRVRVRDGSVALAGPAAETDELPLTCERIELMNRALADILGPMDAEAGLDGRGRSEADQPPEPEPEPEPARPRVISRDRGVVTLQCPNCETTVRAYKDEVGECGNCPGCSTTILVPEEAFRAPEKKNTGAGTAHAVPKPERKRFRWLRKFPCFRGMGKEDPPG